MFTGAPALLHLQSIGSSFPTKVSWKIQSKWMHLFEDSVSSNVRRLRVSYNNLPKSSDMKPINVQNSTWWFGLVTCNSLQIFQIHPSQRSFSYVVSCFPNHRNQTPTLTHQLTSRRDKKKLHQQTRCHAKKQAKTGLNKPQNFTNLAFFTRKIPKNNPPKLGPWVHPHWTSPARLFLQYATGSLVVWCLCGALRVWVVGWFQGKRPPNLRRKPREKWHGRCGNNCTSRKELYNNMGTKNAFPTACFNLSRSLNLLLDVLIHQAITWWSLQSLH